MATYKEDIEDLWPINWAYFQFQYNTEPSCGFFTGLGSMGACPFCRAQTLPGDSICYSCGRVISGASGMTQRVRGEFSRGTTRRASAGSAPMKKKSDGGGIRRRRKKSKLNQLGLVALIAFIFFTPDAREYVLAKWAELETFIMEGIAPAQVFPVEAEYTVLRSVDLWNNDSGIGHLEESIPIPTDYSSNENDEVSLAYTDGTEKQKSTIQRVMNIELRIDGEIISIPKDGLPTKSKANAVITNQGNEVWWPGVGQGSDYCGHGSCVRISMDIPEFSQESVDLAVTIEAKSHSWWHSTRVDGKVEGKSVGASVSRSGTFDDISERGEGTRYVQFGQHKEWYDRNECQPAQPNCSPNFAISGKQSTAPTVVQTAASIEASLPSDLKDNVYAYGRATFDWLNQNVPYDYGAGVQARSGEICLVDGLGDCDEQSNAFMSIMRVKGVPTWYAFGALTDPQFESWQGHGWAYIMIPLSDEWCEDNDVVLNTCYVEGSVDVVNRKWLVHTPTAYIDWIEKTPASLIGEYYTGGTMSGIDRVRSFSTEDYSVSGGTWSNKWLQEAL